MFRGKRRHPYGGKRQPEKPKMLWKASFFICWIAGQLPVQRTISCVLGGNQGGFTEAIPAGRQKPAPPEGTKASRSQACVVEVSPHPHKGDQRGARSGDPHCRGCEVELPSPLGGFLVLTRPAHKWSRCPADCSGRFSLGIIPQGHVAGKQGRGHNGGSVTGSLAPG